MYDLISTDVYKDASGEPEFSTNFAFKLANIYEPSQLDRKAWEATIKLIGLPINQGLEIVEDMHQQALARWPEATAGPDLVHGTKILHGIKGRIKEAVARNQTIPRLHTRKV